VIKILITSVFCALLWQTAIAQNAITGTISDSESKENLISATIYLPELRLGTVTNLDGAYKLENIPNGTFKVQISFIGYETAVQSVHFTGKKEELNVSLNPTVIEAEPVVISSGYPSTQDESPVKIEQLSAQEIARSGSSNLMETLTQIPGIHQVSTGAGIGKPVIRGLRSNRVLVYSQGVRIENQQWGDEHGLGLSDMGVERVEIIKGPSSLLYGSDAMGGVLHLIDDRPADVGTVVGDYNLKMFSNTLGVSSNLGIKGTGKKFRFNVRGGAESHMDYQTGKNEAVENTRFNGMGLKSSIGYNNAWVSSTLSYNYLDSKFGLVHLEEEEEEHEEHEESERKPLLPYQHITNHITSLQNTVFVGESKLKFNIGFVQNQRLEFEEHHEEDTTATAEEHHDDEAALDMTLQTMNYDLKWYFPARKKTEYVIGVQGMSQTNTNAGEEVLIPDATQNDFGVLGMVKYQYEKVTMQAGMRYDVRSIATTMNGAIGEEGYMPALDLSFSSFNGSLGATFHLNDQLLLRTNVATGFRNPNLAELSSNGVHHGTNRYEIGNGNLSTEQNIEFDISSHYHTEHTTIDLAGFFNNISNYIFITPTDSIIDSVSVFEYTQSDARLFGGEFTLDIHPHPIDWLHFETKYGIVIGQKSDGSHLPLIPAGKLTLSARAEFKGNKRFIEPYFKVSSVFMFDQNNIADFETKTDAYNLLNIGLGSSIKLGKQTAQFSISANNILNVSYFDHLSRLKNAGIYNMGRNISVSMKLPFGLKANQS
jgi:iron complex outermembrane receptor protein